MSDSEVIPGQPPESASPMRGVHSVHAVAAAATSDAARPSRAKRLLFAAVVAGVSLLAALLLAEAVVRLAMPQPLASPLYTETSFGFGILPNLRGLAIESDDRRVYHVTTDAHGFRGRRAVSDAPTSGTRRVLVLGDSFAFGVTGAKQAPAVESSAVADRTANRARAKVGAAVSAHAVEGPRHPSTESSQQAPGMLSPPGRYELVNAACPGWGTENELGYWRQQGHLLRPDLLVVVYFENDLLDNLRNQVYQVRDGRVAPAPAPSSASLARRLARAAPSAQPAPPVAASPTPSVAAERPLARETGIYRALMEALLDDAARDHVPVLLVILPWTADLDGPRMPQITEIEQLAAEWGRDRPDFRVLDAYAPFLAAKQRGEDLFLPVDRHFTPAAHRLMGDLLAERIRAILEDPKEPPR